MKKIILLLTIIIAITTSCSSQRFGLKDSLIKPGDTYVTYDIAFDLAKETIRPESFKFLDSVVIFLKENNNLTIEISNHCDERYKDIYATCLTCKRAKSIADYLISKGIKADRLVANGYNATNPLIKGAKTEEEHQKNRRTEFKVLRNDYK
jgi:outer membrane protein OmpA-like peptidoglycan-associated protein